MSLELLLRREPTKGGATVGELFVQGEVGRFAWTLEDPVREVPGLGIPSWKIPAETAIPVGRYRVAITYSPRFKQRMPILLHVPGFEGIRIHWGNRATDTEGCILVGSAREGQMVLFSRECFERVYTRIEIALLAAEEVWISIG